MYTFRKEKLSSLQQNILAFMVHISEMEQEKYKAMIIFSAFVAFSAFLLPFLLSENFVIFVLGQKFDA
jgi:hypothetical protein